MIDINKETSIAVKQARRILPNRPSINTVYRWFWKGLRGGKLDSVRVGGRVFATEKPCHRIVHESLQIPTDDERCAERDAIRRARQFLDASGL